MKSRADGKDSLFVPICFIVLILFSLVGVKTAFSLILYFLNFVIAPSHLVLC